MNGLLIAHGEKIVLALVFVICGYAIYAKLTDETIRAEATLAELSTISAEINEANSDPGDLNFQKTREFHEEIAARAGLQPQAQEVIAYLTAHPSQLGAKIVDPGTEIYGYEIGRPVVQAEDRIGSIAVEVTLPSAARPNRERDVIKDGLTARWFRQAPGVGDVVNAAQTVAVLIEYSIGDDAPQPLDTPMTPGGIAMLGGTNSTGEIVLSNVEEWAAYRIEARALVAATAGGLGARRTLGSELVVFDESVTLSEGDLKGLTDIADRISSYTDSSERPPRRAARMFTGDAASVARAAMIDGVAPDRLSVFQGDVSPFVEVQTRSRIYMGLKRAREQGANTDAQASIILKKLELDAQGNELGWTPDTDYVVKLGEPIGEMEQMRVPWSNFQIPVDLRTPFVLKEVKGNEDRIWYWEIELASKMGDDGKFTKELVIDSRAKKTDLIILENQKTGNEVQLMEFATIPRPRWNAGQFPQDVPPIFPIIPESGINEQELFRDAPQDYRPPLLMPRKPELSWDEQRLAEVIGDRLAQVASLPFVIVPDGRVYAYLPLDRQVTMGVIAGSAFERGDINRGRVEPSSEEEADAELDAGEEP